MQKQTLRLRKRSASRFLFPSAATGLALFFLFVIFPLVPEIKLASATIDNTVYGLELATNPSINLSIQPTAAGAISVAKDTVIANTNSPSGYKLYLSVNKDLDNNIYLNGDISNDSASTKFIPTTGTFETPSALDQNSWGYAVAGLNSFDVSYNNPTISSKFASISLAGGGEQLIHDHTGVATDDATDIYYGIKADINIASGNYSTELLYTTLSDASSEVQGEAEVSPSQVDNGYVATELTITTSLVTNKNLGTISAMIGNQSCEDIELVTNNPVTVTCTLPAGLVGGKYNVVLNIPNLGKSYTIENGFEVSPQVTVNVASSSTGYGTISNNGFIAPYGTPITTNGNTITIGDQTITATPAAQTVQYDYAFASWTNNCGATVTANCTISANFTRTTRSYTVTFVAGPSGYGTASRSSQTVVYGESVSVSGATATVAGTATTATPAAQTAQYTYAFSNWTNNCGATVTGNCTITANFSRTTRSYTVTFAVNASGYGTTSRSSQTVTYGGAVSVSGATVTVAGTATTATPAAQTAQYTYAFASWTNNCGATVTGNCTITANFSRTTRSYTVTWNANGGSVSPTTTTKEYGTALGTLPTPTYTGYNFGGWFTAASGGSQIATTTTVTGNVTYYAHWTPINLSNITNMQQMTSSICANTATNTSKQLVDTRDNKLYWVTKLADGNCWMTQNLDYDIVKGNNIIASMTSYSTTTWNAPRATQTNYFGNETATETYSYDHGNYYLPDGSGSKTAITCTTSSNGGANCHYHLGNLYQFNAAAGGTAQSSGDSTYSICPAGWRLPERNSSATKGLPNLLSKYSSSQANDNILLASPLYFVRSGNDDWSISSVGRIGYIWTGYGGSSSLADYFYYSSGYVRNATVGRYQGFSVRCVAI